jgi:hypothetical protein
MGVCFREMTSSMAGVKGGSDYSKDISNTGSKNQKEKDRDKKPEFPTFKYSSRFRGALHEAVLLNGEPVFLTYQNGHLKTVK